MSNLFIIIFFWWGEGVALDHMKFQNDSNKSQQILDLH